MPKNERQTETGGDPIQLEGRPAEVMTGNDSEAKRTFFFCYCWIKAGQPRIPEQPIIYVKTELYAWQQPDCQLVRRSTKDQIMAKTLGWVGG